MHTDETEHYHEHIFSPHDVLHLLADISQMTLIGASHKSHFTFGA
jgi:hypothetical protein